MASLRDIRRRIKSVVSIKQITRAMEMVATTKLRRFQARSQAVRPFALELEAMVARLAPALPAGASPLLEEPGVAMDPGRAKLPVGILVVTSDRGLCGAHNTNVLSQVHRFLRERGLETAASKGPDLSGKARLYVVGRKGFAYYTRRGYEIAHFFGEPILEKMTRRDCLVVAKTLANDFIEGQVREIFVASTRFESMVSFKPQMSRWLPIARPEATGASLKDVIVEPEPAELVKRLLPQHAAIQLANLLLEALTAEYASRRVSMKNATDAAEDMRSSLLRTYNRARQETITKQLLEIVGGAEALK